MLHGVTLDIWPGEIVGLVGETGSGKTMTALSILRLLPPGGRLTRGRLLFDGADVLTLAESQVRRLRGREIGTIFQQPRAALNPTRPVLHQVADRLVDLRGLGRNAATRRALELLERVGLPEPGVRGRQFPHQLSGGMCQRVMIAMAVAGEPRLLLADEPTTGLDVTLQLQILRLIADLAHRSPSIDRSGAPIDRGGMATLLISHDLAMVAETCSRVAVMYAGEIVEVGPSASVLDDPKHPYTQGLVRAVVSLEEGRRPEAIPGVVPRFHTPPHFCPFVGRCPHAFDLCRRERPALRPVLSQQVACHLYPEEAADARDRQAAPHISS